MSQNKKCFVNRTVVAVTFRTEEGLPLPPNPIIIVILQSIFARAQSLYPVTICHFLVMSNHIHMLLVVQDPADVPLFVGYVKQESAHAINALMGRRKRTIWEDGYDSPAVVDAARVQRWIEYMLTNPQYHDLVDKIEDYPHLSSWPALLQGIEEMEYRRIPRSAIPHLKKGTLSVAEQREIADSLLLAGEEECQLIIEPDSWMSCFDKELKDEDAEEINQRIVAHIREEEAKFREKRQGSVIGAHALKLQRMNKKHVPEKRGKRTVCWSSFEVLRKAFLSWYRENYPRTPKGSHLTVDWLAKLPPGNFAPGGRLYANINPAFMPTSNTAQLYR